jgi:sporulation protein YlmC with PRC-barrel domain
METYAVLRRSGFDSADELRDAVERSRSACEGMPDDLCWVRSYVLEEEDGRIGSVCIIEASSLEALHIHAGRADLPVDEIIKVGRTVVVTPDPVPVDG